MTQLPPISQQISVLMNTLEGMKSGTHDQKDKIIKWVRDLPPASRPAELFKAIQRAFGMSEDELNKILDIDRKKRKKDFDSLVPTGTWLEDYMAYTRNTEPPSVFHFFAGCVAIGSILARNVYFDKGPYQVYPNLAVLIIAPSGKCRKTSACNIAMNALRKAGGNVLADKLTPEAFAEAFKEKATATGTIYAPEFSVFLGKQKYQEGMIPMLTALFDCPTEWRSTTITRGEVILRKVALSMLGCSTMDWLQTAIPKDAFGGGFMSRLLFVVQTETPRSFPLPPMMDLETESKLIQRLIKLTHLRGQYAMSEEAKEWYVAWYNARKDESEDKHFAGYSERKPDHMIRLAIILAAARSDVLILERQDLKRALAILDFTEEFLPHAFGEMTQTQIGEDHTRLIKQIKKRGGKIQHSEWLRLNSNRMQGIQFRNTIDTLRVAQLVDYDTATKVYYLTPEGWNY